MKGEYKIELRGLICRTVGANYAERVSIPLFGIVKRNVGEWKILSSFAGSKARLTVISAWLF